MYRRIKKINVVVFSLNGPGGGPMRRENVEWPWEGAYAMGKGS